MLSTGLFVSFGAGAVATADSDSATAAGTQATDSSTQTASTPGPTASVQADPTAQPSTTEGAGTSDSSTGASSTGTSATSTPASTDAQMANQIIDPSSAPQSGSNSSTSTPSTGSSQPTAAATDSNGSASDSDALSTDTTNSSSNAPTVTTTIQQLADAFTPAATAVTNAVSDTVANTPAQIMALPTSPTPMADVITSVQQMLSTVAQVVAPLVQTAGDLYSLLGVPPTTQPPLIGESSVPVPTVDFAAPLFGPQTVQWAAVVPAASISGPLFGTMTPPPDPIVLAPEGALAQQMSLSGMASLAPEGVRPLDAKTFLQHVVTAVLVPASLTALAALALPGIGGLLVVSAFGMRIGYRQAKAALTMRASGIARFANTGPLGVVRSGALVSLHTRNPRAERFVRPEAAQAPIRHLERVA